MSEILHCRNRSLAQAEPLNAGPFPQTPGFPNGFPGGFPGGPPQRAPQPQQQRPPQQQLPQQPKPQPQQPPQPSNTSTGSLMKVWMQDPSVKGLDASIATMYFPYLIGNGPSDSDIQVKTSGVTVNKNASGDFLFDPAKNSKEFDCVHVYSVVRSVLDMYKRTLKGFGSVPGVNTEFNWAWGKGPLMIDPYAGVDQNAFYSRNDKAIKLFYFTDKKGQPVYTARSIDIVSHEAGHAILDGLRPGYFESKNPETFALHEAFGDLTNLFLLLDNPAMCEAVCVASKGNLHNRSFFNTLGEQFGVALGMVNGLRDADNDLTLADLKGEKQAHELSKVFTGGMYDILADIFDFYKKEPNITQTQALSKAGEHVKSLLVLGVLKAPAQEVAFLDVVKQMQAIETNPTVKQIIEKNFATRLGTSIKVALASEEQKEPMRLRM